MVSLSSSKFWTEVEPLLGKLQTDGPLKFVVLDQSSDMHFILRTAEETMTSFVSHHWSGFKLIVNGNMFGASSGDKIWAMFGFSDAPDHTQTLGRLIDRGKIVGGGSQSQRFYFARTLKPLSKGAIGPLLPVYTSGFGDPPVNPNTMAAVGGAGPMIIDGLKYGDQNVADKSAPLPLPLTGEPPAADKPFMRQRSNTTFTSAESRPAETGKTILGFCSKQGRIIVIVQPHGGSSGTSYASIRDRLAALGVDHSVFLDGSDSVFMWHDGKFAVSPARYKDNLNTVAVGFT